MILPNHISLSYFPTVGEFFYGLNSVKFSFIKVKKVTGCKSFIVYRVNQTVNL